MRSPEEKELHRMVKPRRAEWWILGAALLASAALLVIAMLSPRVSRADDKASRPPDTIPALAGIWMLDKEHSDDPSKLRPPGGHGGYGGGGMHGGGGMGGGGGWGGGGGHHHGGGGWGGGGGEGGAPDGGPPPDGANGSSSGGDRPRPTPQPAKLIIFRKGDAFSIDDGSGRERELDWAADAPDTGGVVPAHWNGDKLVAQTESERGSRSLTYELDKDGKALTVTMKMQRPGGDSVSLKSRYTKYEGTEP